MGGPIDVKTKRDFGDDPKLVWGTDILDSQLFFEGKRDEAIAAVPNEFADEISLVGPLDRIRDRLQPWKETPVTTLLVATQDKKQLAMMADLVLGS